MERFVRSAPGTTLALALTLACGSVRHASASVVYVNANATSPNPDGKTWATAFASIDTALRVALPGDEVWVAASAPAAPAYSGSLVWPRAGVPLYGGFAGNETTRDQRDCKSHPTVINDAAVLCTASDAGLEYVLDGLTFHGPASIGDALVEVSAGAKVNVVNCTFRISGSETWPHSAIGVSNGSAMISGCAFTGESHYVAGVSVYSAGKATVSNSEFTGNRTALGVQGGTLNVFNCSLRHNVVGISVYQSGAVAVMNCTLTANTGAAVYVDNGVAHVVNSIVAYNGTGIQGAATGIFVTLDHNDVYGNVFANYAGITDPTGSGSNISVDPRLANPDDNLHIQPDSPCIDAGDDSAVLAGWTDIDGQPRILGNRVDMGADEGDGTNWPDAPRIWYVRATGSDAADGLSWSTAKRTIGGAFTVAHGTDEVWVAKGTYAENLALPGGVALYGGFAGTETKKSQRDWRTNVTVLDGQSQDTVQSDYLRATLDGITIGNGATGLTLSGGTASILHCTFRGNSAAGISNGATITVADCLFDGNADGVLTRYGSAAKLSDCLFSGNLDGVHTQYGTDTIADCAFVGNVNGVHSAWGTTTLAVNGCTLSGNTGSAFFLEGGKTTVTNCILAYNASMTIDGQYFHTVSASHSDLYGRTGEWPLSRFIGTNGNVSADPLFVNRLAGDYHLRLRSPCIDAGDDSVVTPGETDLDGLPRIQRSHVDMGCYEFPGMVKCAPTQALGGVYG